MRICEQIVRVRVRYDADRREAPSHWIVRSIAPGTDEVEAYIEQAQEECEVGQ